MDFILPMLGVVIGTFLIPLILLPVYTAGFFFSKQNKKESPVGRFMIGYSGMVGLSFLTMCALFWIWCFAVDYSMQNPHRGEDKAKLISEHFGKVSERLYKARSDNDPVIGEFRKLLSDSGASETFRLGPIHDGRRELAIVDDIACYAICRTDEHRWYGGSPASDHATGREHTEYVDRAVVDNSDFKFVAVRNGPRIDVRLYTSIYCNQKWQNPPVDFLKGNLCDDFWQRYLGRVTICPKRLAEREKAMPIEKIQRAFMDLLT
jgi:hypothetical protein